VITQQDGILTDPYDMETTFKNRVDLVIDGGIVGSELSSIVNLINDAPIVVRTGKGDVSSFL
jgi:tRNA A37 threonylcarbamoyladenosine synthetase subunit TsaC/SUA5/YrdC